MYLDLSSNPRSRVSACEILRLEDEIEGSYGYIPPEALGLVV